MPASKAEQYDPASAADQSRAVEDLWNDARAYFSDWHAAHEREFDFLFHFDHWENAEKQTKDHDAIRPSGRESFSKHRRKLAQILKLANYLQTRPVDDLGDEVAAEEARYLIEYDMGRPRKRWKRVLRRAVSTALAARMGCITLDVDYSSGQAEVQPRYLPPDKLFWTPGWDDPDDPTCPWVIEERTMRLVAIEAMKAHGWTLPDQLMPDDGPEPTSGARPGSTTRPLREQKKSWAGAGPWRRSDSATVLLCWYRDVSLKEQRATGGEEELPEEDRFLLCPLCNWTSAPQGDSELPAEGVPCPDCGTPTGRVDVKPQMAATAKYPRGRLVVAFPYMRHTAFDNDWPWNIRNAPYWTVRCYEVPGEAWPTSDTAADWDYQIISDGLMARFYAQMQAAGGLIIAPGAGLVEQGTGKPYQFKNVPLDMAIWNESGPPAVQFFQAPGLNAAGPALWNMAQGALRGDMGTGELGLTAQQSKNIPVGTVNAIIESGEIVEDDHGEQLRETLSDVFGVWYDLIRATWTERRLVRMKGPEGKDIFKRMRASDLPDMDVEVMAEPRWTQFDAERITAIQQLMTLPGPLRRVMAKAANMPPSILRELDQAEAEMAAQAAGGPAIAPQGAGGQTPPAGPPQNGNGSTPVDEAALMSALLGAS